jgi:diaminohydroxyphosphoribosylaminopyrimidine deaminase/5-amino-6-(5-phosphoribosylamino)uracil reductase
LIYTLAGTPALRTGIATQPETVETVTAVGDAGQVDLKTVLDDLGGRGVLDLLVEGGPTLAASFLAAGLVDRIVWYLGPLLGGGPGRAALAGDFPTLATGVPLRFLDVARVGDDIRIIAEVPPHAPDDDAPVEGTGGG